MLHTSDTYEVVWLRTWSQLLEYFWHGRNVSEFNLNETKLSKISILLSEYIQFFCNFEDWMLQVWTSNFDNFTIDYFVLKSGTQWSVVWSCHMHRHYRKHSSRMRPLNDACGLYQQLKIFFFQLQIIYFERLLSIEN